MIIRYVVRYINFPFFENFGTEYYGGGDNCERSKKLRRFISNFMTPQKNDLFLLYYWVQARTSDYRWTEQHWNFKDNEDIIKYQILMTWTSDHKNQQKKV